MKTSILLLLLMGTLGCGKKPEAKIAPTPDEQWQAEQKAWKIQDDWDEKFAAAGELTVQASLDCLSEEIKSPTASLRGPRCREFCRQNDALMEMQENLPAGVMLKPANKIRSSETETCPKRQIGDHK